MKKIFCLLVLVTLLLGSVGCTIRSNGSDGFEFSFSTANMTDAVMTTDIQDCKPVDTVTTYPQDAPHFIAVGILNNAPEDTKVKFVWNYITVEQVIDEVVVDAEGKSDVYISSTLSSDNLWPTGDYSVDIYIEGRDDPDATVLFSVE